MGVRIMGFPQGHRLRSLPDLAHASIVAVLKFLLTFSQKAPWFPFALGPAKYVAYSDKYTIISALMELRD